MSANKNTLLPVSIIIGAIIISFGLFYGLAGQQGIPNNSEKSDLIAKDKPTIIEKEEETFNPILALTEEDHIFGNPDAKISLIEYSDFECPYCQRFHTTPELIVEEFNEDVNWVYRHYPLSFHDPAATLEAKATECANEIGGNDVFWEYAGLVFNQTPGNGKGIDENGLVALADDLDIDTNSFKECLDSDKFLDHIRQDFNSGSKLGVSGTPATFVINHETGKQQLVSGAQPYESVKAIVEDMM